MAGDIDCWWNSCVSHTKEKEWEGDWLFWPPGILLTGMSLKSLFHTVASFIVLFVVFFFNRTEQNSLFYGSPAYQSFLTGFCLC